MPTKIHLRIVFFIAIMVKWLQALDEPPLVTSDTNIYYALKGKKRVKNKNDYVVAPSHYFKYACE